MVTSPYFKTAKRKGLEFTQDFYDLGLAQKYVVLASMEQQGLLDEHTLVRAANAILQHSPKQSRDTNPVKSVRKLSRRAKIADDYNSEHNEEVANLLRMACLIVADLESNQPK